jgi:hypothetical protein
LLRLETQQRSIKRVLEPVERISEFLFGLTAARFEWKTSWRLVLVIDSERVAGSILRRQREYQNSTTQVLDAGHGIASPSYVEADVRWSRECRMPEADGSLSFYFFDVDDNLLSFP